MNDAGLLLAAMLPSVHPFGNLATPLSGGAHGFASPPHDGFAFVEDEEVENKETCSDAVRG